MTTDEQFDYICTSWTTSRAAGRPQKGEHSSDEDVVIQVPHVGYDSHSIDPLISNLEPTPELKHRSRPPQCMKTMKDFVNLPPLYSGPSDGEDVEHQRRSLMQIFLRSRSESGMRIFID